MKRTLAAILTVIAVVFTLASCGNTEENLLPFGLQFGCSEADFLKRLEKSGYEVEIEQANTNNGFVSSAIRMTFKYSTPKKKNRYPTMDRIVSKPFKLLWII